MNKILCLDQATQKTGYSIWQDKELVTYGLLEVDKKEKNIIERMKLMNDRIIQLIEDICPDFVCFEDVQYQNNQLTFKQLSQLQGVIMSYLMINDYGFMIVKPSEWKSACKIKGRKREEQKINTIKFVLDMFKVDVSEDIADAIGIGYWCINKVKTK